MTKYFIRRLLLVVPTFLGISVLVFTVTRFVPGGPIERMIMEAQMGSQGRGGSSDRIGGAALSDDQLLELKRYYGFDKPVLISYGQWLAKVVSLDLGQSTRYGEPVWETIKERLPISTFYGLATLILTYLICIPLGVAKALKHRSVFDNISSVVVFTGYAVPGYVVGVLLLVFLGAHWEIFPLGGFTSDAFSDLNWWDQIKDILYHAVMPLTAYMAGSLAIETFLLKNNLLDNLAADYVRTAIAKGLPFRQAVLRHALQNSLIPIATHFGNNISLLIAGSFLIEKIFNINGFGLLGYEAIVDRDYPVVMGILVISASLQLFGNILSDVCVALVDPRVQFE